MIKRMQIEFLKNRHRRNGLLVLCICLAQLGWMAMSVGRWDQEKMKNAWNYFFYAMPLLNCMMMPIFSAVMASRMADSEHKGGTFNLLKTLESAGQLFSCKAVYGSLFMLLTAAIQTLLMLGISFVLQFPGSIPWTTLGWHFLSTAVVTLAIYYLQQSLALCIPNQLVSLVWGLAGAFIGFMSNLFPAVLQRLVLWSYYTVMITTGMVQNADDTIGYQQRPFDWSSLMITVSIMIILFVTGRQIFKRKEW